MSAYSVQSGDYILYSTSAIPQQHTVYSRTVSASVLAAGSTLVAAAPAQAVLELSGVERLPTPATVQTSNATLAASDGTSQTFGGLRFVSQHRLARVTAIADRILNASPAYDVVALQELWLKSDHALVAEAVAPVLPYSTVFYSGAFGSGLSLFSRYPIEQAQMHPFALAGDPIDVLGGDWFVGKGVAAATLAHPVLGHVELLTSHMFARGGETGTVLQQAHRLIGAWEYSQLIRRAAELGRYVIVAGTSTPRLVGNTQSHIPAVPIVFPIPKEGAATSALAAIHQHGVTADSPLNSWSPENPSTLRPVDTSENDSTIEAKVVMTERMADFGCLPLGPLWSRGRAWNHTSRSQHPAGTTRVCRDQSRANATEILPPLPIPPPVARTRALVLHDTLHVLHAAIPASYAASTAYLTTGIACAFSLVALAVAAGAVGWGPNAKRHRPRVERSNTDNTSPVRAERKRTRAYTTPSPTHPTDPQSPQTPLSSPPPSSPPPALRLPFLPSSSSSTKSRPIQAPWWLGIVLVLAGGLLAAAGTTLLYAGVLFGRWERNAIWDVIDQMERLSSRGGIGQ
ncbi:DNase I-like protein [Rhizoctonia solani]|uniref:DNase I-like protein n=1 Tax=Rhizoctonia solani TaxID=456999 RepID=A0A8H7I8M8_9AGAM|nr:DNase I-like protein [Rhizoctonia solani]